MKRYDMYPVEGHPMPTEDPTGEWVRYEDVEAVHEALTDTGMKLALMVDAIASQGHDPSELERELLNPIQRVLGAHESTTLPRT